MVANIPQVHHARNFYMNVILLCYCHSQITGLCQIFKEFISHLHIIILSVVYVYLQTELQQLVFFLWYLFFHLIN